MNGPLFPHRSPVEILIVSRPKGPRFEPKARAFVFGIAAVLASLAGCSSEASSRPTGPGAGAGGGVVVTSGAGSAIGTTGIGGSSGGAGIGMISPDGSVVPGFEDKWPSSACKGPPISAVTGEYCQGPA